jgi:hypothetical protein
MIRDVPASLASQNFLGAGNETPHELAGNFVNGSSRMALCYLRKSITGLASVRNRDFVFRITKTIKDTRAIYDKIFWYASLPFQSLLPAFIMDHDATSTFRSPGAIESRL